MINHDFIERNAGVMGVLIAIAISFGGLAEIVPLMYQAQTTEPSPGVKPYPPLELAGRDVYVKEGCYNCHSQMVRPFVSESLRYGPASQPGESVYDRPFQWGSKRTGPDLARVGGRYTDQWHLMHLMNPRDLVPESNMPGFPWLADNKIDPDLIQTKLRVLQGMSHPYTDEEIAAAPKVVEGKSEMDALIAYLQLLGLSNNGRDKK